MKQEEFKKPQRLIIDPFPYLKSIIGKGFIKDLQENEIICQECQGTGLAIYDAPYGLSDDPDKHDGNLLPYKQQTIGSCHKCYNGVMKICPYCGKELPRSRYRCDCIEDKAEWERLEAEKEQEIFKKAIKLDTYDVISKNMEMYQSDYFSNNEGYFSEWEDFFDDWFDNHEENEPRPEYVWGTTKQKIGIDAGDIIENATDDLWEDAADCISQEDRDKLQSFLDEWCEKQIGTTTYMITHKYAVKIPWDEYENNFQK
jgi:hypothetical protein